MSIFVLFFVELMMMRYGKFGASDGHGAHPEPSAHNHGESSLESSPLPSPLPVAQFGECYFQTDAPKPSHV
jgi:hypothetical protein